VSRDHDTSLEIAQNTKKKSLKILKNTGFRKKRVIGYRHRQICIRFDQQGRWPVKTGFTDTVNMSGNLSYFYISNVWKSAHIHSYWKCSDSGFSEQSLWIPIIDKVHVR
jgi:hypothetical protein